MLHRPRVWVVSALVFVAAVSAAMVFAWPQIFKSNKSQSSSSTGVVSARPQTAEESAAVQADVASFEQVSKAYNAKDYTKTVSLAKSYSANDKNDITLRLNSYNLCVRAAFISKDTTNKDDCYANALKLVATLDDQIAIDGWRVLLQQALTNIVDLGDQNKGDAVETQ